MSRALGALGCAVFIWASAFAAIRASLEAFDPAELAFARLAVASLLFAAYAAVGGVGLPARADLPRIALTGLLLLAVYNVALNVGEQDVTAGAASLLIATAPLFTAAFAAGLLRERLTGRGVAALAVGFAGAALVAVGDAGGVRLEAAAGLILLAAGAEALAFVLQKPLLARYSAVDLTAYAVWISALATLPFAPGAWSAAGDASAEPLLAMLYLAVFATMAAYVLAAFALARMSTGTYSAALYLLPPVAVAVAWVWLGEQPSLLTVVGGGVALVGVALASRAAPSATAEPVPA